MANKVIVDGTYFDYPSKKTPAIKDFLEGKLSRVPRSVVTAMLRISLNDTSRMISIRDLLKDPTSRAAFKGQYNALKDNILMVRFREMHAQKPDFDTLAEKDKMASCTFMQTLGQNLRVMSELDKDNPKPASLFRDYVKKGVKPDLRDPRVVGEAYRFIIEKLTDKEKGELGPTGFATGMNWLEAEMDEINKKYEQRCGMELITDPYSTVWKDYRSNAKAVIVGIRRQVGGLHGKDRTDAKRAFVLDCLEMARNQTGLLLKEQQRIEPAYKAGTYKRR